MSSIQSIHPDIRDFVLELYSSVRLDPNPDEVGKLYEDFKVITEAHYRELPWPDSKYISNDCRGDEVLILFYKEITQRHLITKLKPQFKDFVDSWTNYCKIFDLLLSSDSNLELALSVQWISDIMAEFVYQFQGFCQFRNQVNKRSADDIRNFTVHPDIWSYPVLLRILNGLIRKSGLSEKTCPRITLSSPLIQQFGYFSCIEMARLECLACDYLSSLRVSSYIDLNDRSELFEAFPTCHVNLYYHTTISQLMIRRFTDATDTLNNVILYISRILKPGVASLKDNVASLLRKMLDKLLFLAAIATTLCPSKRVEDQVREQIQAAKFRDGLLKDKLADLQEGKLATFRELFEASSPKFIVCGEPELTVKVDYNLNNYNRQIDLFMTEISENIDILQIRSFLRLYAAIEVPKLARFIKATEPELIAKLISFKHKLIQVESSKITGEKSVFTSDVNFTVQDETVTIDSNVSRYDKEKSLEKFFISGVRKNAEIYWDITKAAAKVGF